LNAATQGGRGGLAGANAAENQVASSENGAIAAPAGGGAVGETAAVAVANGKERGEQEGQMSERRNEEQAGQKRHLEHMSGAKVHHCHESDRVCAALCQDARTDWVRMCLKH